MSRKLLELRGISKRFPGVVALDNVEFDLKAGEIHALVGENGAGKSTLLKITTGVHQLDEGSIFLGGEPVTFNNPLDAKKAGIAAIYQEHTCFPQLSISENVFMGHPLVSNRLQRIDWKGMHQRTKQLLQELEINLDPKTTMNMLNVAERQLVEIAKALSLDSKILLMDEPTSSLTIQEAERLFAVIRRLRDDGVAIVFISHRLDEVFELSDRITVLRDGKYIGTKDTKEITTQEVIRWMVGRSMDELYPKRMFPSAESFWRSRTWPATASFGRSALPSERERFWGLQVWLGPAERRWPGPFSGLRRWIRVKSGSMVSARKSRVPGMLCDMGLPICPRIVRIMVWF